MPRDENLALLGYPPHARLLIINGDDLGMCHAANAATFQGLEEGLLTSASLMVPCPWAYHACAHLREHPQLDVGVHLTVTSEWERYRWGPVLPRDQVPSLCNRWGFFPTLESEVWSAAELAEAMAEAEAQIARAREWGLDPSHLDGHMSTFYAEPRFLAVYLELAKRHRLPLRMAPRRMFVDQGAGELYDSLPLADVLHNDELRFVELRGTASLEADLLQTLRCLEPGVTELCVHVAADTPEARDVMPDVAARVEALRLMTSSDAVRREIEQQGIVLIGWRALADAQRHVP